MMYFTVNSIYKIMYLIYHFRVTIITADNTHNPVIAYNYFIVDCNSGMQKSTGQLISGSLFKVKLLKTQRNTNEIIGNHLYYSIFGSWVDYLMYRFRVCTF